MKRNLPLIFVLPLAVILLLTAIIPIYARFLSAATGISKVINLTNSGFSPTSITIYPGTTVTWTNQTTTAYTLFIESAASTSGNTVYLPVILSDYSSGSTLISNQPIQASEIFSITLPAGGMTSHQFTTTGSFNFYLEEMPEFSGTVTVNNALLVAWILNTTNETSAILRDGGNPILVNVQSVQQTTLSGAEYALVDRTGIPNYTHTMTITDVQTLNNRPEAATDFVGGVTSATVGQLVQFGTNLGFINNNCPAGEGRGYWPPGPSCPGDVSSTGGVYFPLTQQANATECQTGPGTIGLWVNGAAIFNWDDTFYYDPADNSSNAIHGVWQNLAPALETYDVDICGGHAAGDTYHHHSFSSCLSDQLDDTGQSHSPIYGFAADGYPVYGPWHDNGVLAQSCWKKRDYSASSSTGCGVDNKRTCLLTDQYDITTIPVTTTLTMPHQFGPDVTDTVTSLSGNSFTAESGIYFQDYYYDSACTALGGPYLDEHNGHDHDGLGYHYHVTAEQDGDSLTGVFPFIIGPTFYGELQDQAVANCYTPPGGP